MKSPVRGVAVTLGVIFVGCFGLLFGVLDWLVQAAWHLTFGWAYYFARTVPQVAPSPAEFAVAGVALVVLAAGGHQLGRWLAPPLLGVHWRRKWTAQAVGLLVLLFVCGTAAIGVTHQTAWLVRSPEPLTESSGGMREVSGRVRAANNLKQLGLGGHTYEAQRKRLPAPTFSPDGRPLHSWHAFLLPYVEQDGLFSEVDFSKPWSHPVNRRPVETRVLVFEHPLVPVLGDGPKPAHLAPNARLLDPSRQLRVTDLPLGLSNTLLAGEAITAPRPWADPLNWRDPQRPLGSPGGFAGVPGRPIQVVMADGSVRPVTPAGWEPVMRGQPPGYD